MISSILNTLERGLAVMKSNSRLLLVGVLVFVFPLLFVWVTQSFFETAQNNINTAEKKRVGIMHDTLSIVLAENEPESDLVSQILKTYQKENSDISKIRITEETEDGFLVRAALGESIVGTLEESDSLYRTLPLSGSQDSFIYEVSINGDRTWQVFRLAETSSGDLFIFSEHSFALADSIMSARKQQSYLGLTAIFLFLIGLAHWLNKQINWEKNHHKLQHQLKERDLFSNMIAHEFRSPLTAIKGYASFLEESEKLPDEEQRFAGNIKKSAERLVVLVSDFLEVARLQSGKLKIQEEDVDLRDVLKQVTEDLQTLASDKGLELMYDPEPEKISMVTDPQRMTQVITNIVSNAVKYTEKGKVELKAAVIPGEVTVRVMDTGMGISAEDQKKLFAPFTRVGGVDSGETTGTGLGMWITKQLVSLLDGEIGVESIKGVGTHIVITFKT
tara:strand:- start:6645 stop:7982 length:1338 start_codon:yes stop_codon:yes gene_type:complete